MDLCPSPFHVISRSLSFKREPGRAVPIMQLTQCYQQRQYLRQVPILELAFRHRSRTRFASSMWSGSTLQSPHQDKQLLSEQSGDLMATNRLRADLMATAGLLLRGRRWGFGMGVASEPGRGLARSWPLSHISAERLSPPLYAWITACTGGHPAGLPISQGPGLFQTGENRIRWRPVPRPLTSFPFS